MSRIPLGLEISARKLHSIEVVLAPARVVLNHQHLLQQQQQQLGMMMRKKKEQWRTTVAHSQRSRLEEHLDSVLDSIHRHQKLHCIHRKLLLPQAMIAIVGETNTNLTNRGQLHRQNRNHHQRHRLLQLHHTILAVLLLLAAVEIRTQLKIHVILVTTIAQAEG